MAEEAKKPGEGEQEKKPKTAGEVIEEAVPGASGEGGEGDGHEGDGSGDAGKMVPLSSLLEFKKENKEFKKLILDLQQKLEEKGSSKEDIAGEIETLAKEFDVDPKFASQLAKILGAQAEKKVGETIKPLIEQNKKLTDRERQDAIHKAFTKHFDAAMETLPEYKDIVDPEVIKALSLLPANKEKTFAQLIENTYGKAITGKRTIDSTKPGGGKDPAPLDMEKARTDSAYFAEVMADPELKKEYNKRMLETPKRS